ncbi:hypothetical protein BD324DRAFT_622852 [Kockovaella imperatae]|uniref:Uncharacterized protein n=1 Tax=Kockovaella imperatae TaxID=4999 RepID=A0A1Y1UHZ9_9TREE|nr:hypothetical protein BD324DRAFT_622852 [Kockovaella imperatae]ORX37680.1 hypothetical protein BD324DRAFT_622852 [Kockovaella imperatae]
MSFISAPKPINGHVQPEAGMSYMVAHASLKVAQTAGMIVPPAYLLFGLVRRNPLSVSRWMRASVGGVVAGAGLGAGMGYMRLRGETAAALEDRVVRLSHNPSQIRTDDYSIIGSALGALIVPTLLLKRSRLPTLALGGAAIGLGAGVWVHLVRMWAQGADVRPEGMVGEIPVVGGNDKK